ncbi:DNA phosphorothioation-associated putative methyltransferase [Mycolicibacterium fortuitum]|nr:DNA phosphorothioation-associated putative methyltransferase [Mycolicibacterium fortuitum]
MSVTDVARHKTALTRTALSRPIARAVADGLLESGCAVFDYGCGKGDDIRHLRSLGYDADGWDPTHRPTARHKSASIVNLGYVINVIENPAERVQTLRSAWGLTERMLIVSARMTWDARDLVGRPMGDGLLTRSGTFQKFYDQPELATWIEDSVGVHPYAAAPGVFYLFRNETDAQSFLASRVRAYRPRISVSPEALYETHRDVIAPLVAFMSEHAREPRAGELPVEVTDPIREALGGLGRAKRLIRQATEDSYWDQITVQRRAELLIYVALSRFRRRPRFSQLERSLATDIRTLFGTYKQACLEADRMLVACGDQALLLVNARSSKVGKQTPSALYVHRSAMGEIPPMLQVYEGCARVLAGTVEHANMVKLSVTEPQVSYLTYPTFDQDPHPTLHSAVTVNLRRLSVDWRDYSRSENPPLLHRKEEFLGIGDPKRSLYERLTRAEMRAGLYEHPERIGTLQGWRATLANSGVKLRGHRIIHQPRA